MKVNEVVSLAAELVGVGDVLELAGSEEGKKMQEKRCLPSLHSITTP